MERKGLFKLPYQILIYEIPKYLTLKDYISYISTCKFLKDNYEYSDIWKKELNERYTEEEILFAQEKQTPFEKFQKLVTQTINYQNCDIAHRDTCWREKSGSLSLVNVCWLHIIGKLGNVPDGRYVPEFKVKFTRRPLGLGRLEFKASVVKKEIELPSEKKDQELTVVQPKDEDNSTSTENGSSSGIQQVNTVNNSNNKSSLFSVVLSTLSLGLIKTNSTESVMDTSNPSINTNNDGENKKLASEVISFTQNKFNRNTLNLYSNNEWRIVECPEIIIDRTKIDQTKFQLIVELEIKDINGYWKNGLSFKGMQLRKVIPSDSDTEIE